MRRRALLRDLSLLALAACTTGREQAREVAGPAAPTGSPAEAGRSAPPQSARPSGGGAASLEPTEPTGTSATGQPSPDPELEPTHEPDPTPEVDPVEFDQVCRESLGLPEAREDERTHTITGLMLHHTAVSSSSASQAPGRLRGHANFHRDQGWPDIAYHAGVDLDGNVYGLRDTRVPGDTFTEYEPAGWFLLVAEGDFNATTPTPELIEAAARVFAWAAQEFGAPLESLSGHRDEASTTCPGDQLYAMLGQIEERARTLVAEGGVVRNVLCGVEGDASIASIESGQG